MAYECEILVRVSKKDRELYGAAAKAVGEKRSTWIRFALRQAAQRQVLAYKKTGIELLTPENESADNNPESSQVSSNQQMSPGVRIVSGPCSYCGEDGHYVVECPKVTKDAEEVMQRAAEGTAEAQKEPHRAPDPERDGRFETLDGKRVWVED